MGSSIDRREIQFGTDTRCANVFSLWIGCGSFGGFPSFGSSGQTATPAPVASQSAPEIPASIRASEVIGRWGYASFHRVDDRARPEAAARGQCGHPFVIGQGPTGVYPPDKTQMQEFWLKGGAGRKELHRAARRSRRPRRSRDRLVGRPRDGTELRRSR
jgi:hypothetical protein